MNSPQTHAERLTIGQLAAETGVTVDTIRYYEKEALLKPEKRSAGGFRLYTNEAVRRLRFIRHAQQCGMALSEIRTLLDIQGNDRACCDDVRSLAIRKRLQIEHQVRALQTMSLALGQLIEDCSGGQAPIDECPILAAMESGIKSSTTAPPKPGTLESDYDYHD